jgi:sulfhydrogenase subunit gamma (sulfur reductase)
MRSAREGEVEGDKSPDYKRKMSPIPVIGSVYVPSPARIVEIRELTPLDRLFTVELPWGQTLGHQPGQFVEVSVLGIGEAPISISSSPSRSNGVFELCVRRVGDVTNALHALGPGAAIGVRGPFGRGFPVEKMRGKDLLLAVGGLCMAPARSLIYQVLDERGAFGRLIILYGAKRPAELLFTDELAGWSRRGDVEVYITVDRPEGSWTGRAGVITSLFPAIAVDPLNTVAVTLGPPAMYRFVIIELIAKGIPEGQIWLSLERRMKCGVGKCGHCQIGPLYCCQHGPVFSYAQLKEIDEAL